MTIFQNIDEYLWAPFVENNFDVYDRTELLKTNEAPISEWDTDTHNKLYYIQLYSP